MRGWTLALLFVSFASPALAQVPADASAADIAQARELFGHGVEHLRESRWTEACEALDRSNALVETAQTHLNLSVCTGELGRVLDRSEHLRAFLRMAGPTIDPELIQHARAQLADVEPRVPSVVVRPRPADASGVEIRVDGELVPPAAWGTPRPVNPGRVTVVASGARWEAWQTTLPIAEGAHVEIAVPLALRPEVAAAATETGAPEPTSDGGGDSVVIGVVVGFGVAAALGGLAVALYFLLAPAQTSEIPLDVDWRRDAVHGSGATLLRF